MSPCALRSSSSKSRPSTRPAFLKPSRMPRCASSASCTSTYCRRSIFQRRDGRGAAARAPASAARGSPHHLGRAQHFVGNAPRVAQPLERLGVDGDARGHRVLDRQRLHVDAVEHLGRERAGEAAHLEVVGADVEQRALVRRSRDVGEHRDAALLRLRHRGAERREHGDVGRRPQRLRAARDQRRGRFRDRRGVLRAGLDHLDADLGARLLGQIGGDLRVRLGRIPGDADHLQAGEELARHRDRARHRLQGAVARHVRRVVERLATDADAGRGRIGHQREDVRPVPRLVGVGDRLEADGGGGEDEVVVSGGDLGRDRRRGGHVVLGVEARDRERAAVLVAGGGQPIEHAADAFVDDRLRGVLQDGDARRARVWSGCGGARCRRRAGLPRRARSALCRAGDGESRAT